MLGNSFVGTFLLAGEAAALRHFGTETYSTATGKPTKSWTDYPIRVRVRNINTRDRDRLGVELVKQMSKIAIIPVKQLPTGVAPGYNDQIISGTHTWEIMNIRETSIHGIVIEYQCLLRGH